MHASRSLNSGKAAFSSSKLKFCWVLFKRTEEFSSGASTRAKSFFKASRASRSTQASQG